MKIALKLAYRNLMGAGLRTWLNVIVLSFSFVVIIWLQGIMAGWDYQAKTDMTNWEIGGGQYWHENYDPYDPFSFSESHLPVPEAFEKEIKAGDMEPMLITHGSIYPQGRLQAVTIKGINPHQDILELPTGQLVADSGAVPAIIGTMMARSLNLKEGDHVVLRWRNQYGTFDADEIVIREVFSSNVPAAEAGQIYIPLETLRQMTSLPGEATLFTFRDPDKQRPEVEGLVLKTKSELTRPVDDMISAKKAGQSVFYFILLLLAMLAIFDTQVLSVFRRQKEIGTYVALGYTRGQVVGVFTVEGAMHSVFAAVVAAIYGVPFLAWQAHAGWTMPVDVSEYGMAIAQTLYPVYSLGLVVFTT
ncbi:MAG: FtsX-like permease family protein, partial [Bacteroidales bacterium]